MLKAVPVFAQIPQIKTNVNGIFYYEEAKFKQNEISKSFYYIRHGQTDVNKFGIVPENPDVPLNEEGILQAKAAAKLLRDKNIKIIVASPLIRAKQTAEIINKELNIPIIYHDGLKEADWGVVKGENIKEPSKNERIWKEGGEIAGVESLYSFQRRIHNTTKEIVNKYDNVLIVGHGRYFRYLTILLNEEPINARNAVPYYFMPILECTGNKLYQITSLKN